jgi:hypothetical protein
MLTMKHILFATSKQKLDNGAVHDLAREIKLIISRSSHHKVTFHKTQDLKFLQPAGAGSIVHIILRPFSNVLIPQWGIIGGDGWDTTKDVEVRTVPRKALFKPLRPGWFSTMSLSGFTSPFVKPLVTAKRRSSKINCHCQP